jgi:amino acid transporter
MAILLALVVLAVVAFVLAMVMCLTELLCWLLDLPALRRVERRWHAIPHDRWITVAVIPLAVAYGGVLLSYGTNLLSDADGGRTLPGGVMLAFGLGVTVWYLSRHAAGSYQRPTPKVRNRGTIAEATKALARQPPPDLRSLEARRVALLRVNRLGERLATATDGGWRDAWRRERRWLAVLAVTVVAAALPFLAVLAWRLVTQPPTAGRLGAVAMPIGTVVAVLLAMGSRRYRIRRERRLLGRELQQASADLLGRMFDPTMGERVPASVLAEVAATLRRVYGTPADTAHRSDPTGDV